MNTHFFIYNGECYMAHYFYWDTFPRVTKVVNMDDQEIVLTETMRSYAQFDIINSKPILQDA